VKADRPNRSLNTHKRLMCHDALSKDVRSGKSRPRPMSISCYSTALGVIFIRKKLLSEGDTFKEIVLIFMPWFYSQCIRAHYSRAFGSIQASFRTYPLIPNSHPIWKMCETGNLRGLQAFFGDQALSPFSVNSKGMTLLHVSSVLHRPKRNPNRY
jgi:hypothetical protein